MTDPLKYEIFAKFSKKKLTNNIQMSIISISMQIPIGGNRNYDKEHDGIRQI